MGEGFIDYRAFLSGLGRKRLHGQRRLRDVLAAPRTAAPMETLDRYARRFLAYIEEFKSSR